MKKQMVGFLLVRHSTPGRLRLQYPAIRSSEKLANEVEEKLKKLSQINGSDIRAVTGSLIITYDPRKASAEQVLEAVSEKLGLTRSGPHAAPPAERLNHSHVIPLRPSRRSRLYFWGYVTTTAVLSGYLAYAFIRRVFFRIAIAQTPLSVTGVLAAVAAIPLFHKAVTDLKEGKRAGLFAFLTGGCIVAIVAGEALTALEIIWALSIGLSLEEYATENARNEIRAIFQATDETALVLLKGAEVAIPVEELRAGDIVIIEEGRRIPVDGQVIDGDAMVDEATITGRSYPERRNAGGSVYAGTTVVEGSIRVKAETVGDETYIARVLQMIEESLREPADVEKKADELAHRLMKMGALLTLGTLVFTRSYTAAISALLITACPCATILAASTAIAATIANAAKRHVLVKGGLHLEQLDRIDTVCFDKTGTITLDTPQVIDIVPRAPRQDVDKIVALAAGAEAGLAHPLAKSLEAEARSRAIELPQAADREELLGRGIRCVIDEDAILLGSRNFLESEGVDTSYYKSRKKDHDEAGHSVIFLARNGKLQALIAIANALRPGTKEVLRRLRNNGDVQLVLLSGDSDVVVRSVIGDLDFDEVKAELLPEDKAEFIDRLEKSGRKVLMVGDGVNDALALANATVGVGMGAGGSEVAIEAADIALVNDDLEGLIISRQLSKRMLAIIEQNFWFATITNHVSLVMGGLGWFTPVMAGFLHVLHTLGIMGNSSRLLTWEAPGLNQPEDPDKVVRLPFGLTVGKKKEEKEMDELEGVIEEFPT